ncbi:hypothetical protein ADIARSV_1685 [Arcticibacter svalbardensis MN12-7]|uniref:DUF4440 domain-containing protein n=1 Tax=Arcticibacter svalbardensis MN12-7 TaxID=1150600 RepID=R9GTN7_9SPHI|nr:hypothetical protein [Arcticibacter svalbardensis]EOR95197.1 hypothetical protein ADIARSV_1685 [Arcticibacter svalbardensis MN12-7]
MENDILLQEIDHAHLLAKEALKKKDFKSYAENFSNDLKYKQLNGLTINKTKLVNDIAVYFKRVISSSSDYKRITFQVVDDKIIERLVQKSQISLKIFIFFSKKWTIEREGIYEWEKNNGKWEIIRVEIIKEKVY